MTGYAWLAKFVTVAILAGFSSVILVMLLGQSRVFYAMSQDGLVPKVFSEVHPRYKTPWKSNIVFFVFTGLFAAFIPGDIVGEMTSIGTLFAFILVCIGVWIIRQRRPDLERGFRVPALPLVATLGIIVCGAMIYGLGWTNWLRLAVWLVIGLVLYFALRSQSQPPERVGAGESSSGYWSGPRLALALLLVIIAGGTAGYMVIEGVGRLDAFYMTVTTVATVGYREVHALSRAGQVFTVLLIAGGVGTCVLHGHLDRNLDCGGRPASAVRAAPIVAHAARPQGSFHRLRRGPHRVHHQRRAQTAERPLRCGGPRCPSACTPPSSVDGWRSRPTPAGKKCSRASAFSGRAR
jgi:hypothetical protein